MDERLLERRPRETTVHTIRVIAIGAAIVLVVWLLSNVLLLIFMAALIALILRGAVALAVRLSGAPDGAMLALITTLIAVLLLFFLYYLGPKLEQEITQLWSQLNQQVAHMQILSGQNFIDRFVQQEFSLQSGIASHVSTYIGSFATSAVTAAISGFIVIVTALYFAISPSLYVNGIVRLFPLPCRPRARAVMLALGRTLQWWSVGQMIDMITVGLLSGLGMALLGLPLAFALAVLAGLLTFIPYFGAIIAAIPAMIVALTIGWQTSLWVAVIFLVSHTVEGYVVGPLVQRHTVRLPPALTILSMTILGTVFGPLGLILGAPLAAAGLVIVREVYVVDVLGDDDVTLLP